MVRQTFYAAIPVNEAALSVAPRPSVRLSLWRVVPFKVLHFFWFWQYIFLRVARKRSSTFQFCLAYRSYSSYYSLLHDCQAVGNWPKLHTLIVRRSLYCGSITVWSGDRLSIDGGECGWLESVFTVIEVWPLTVAIVFIVLSGKQPLVVLYA